MGPLAEPFVVLTVHIAIWHWIIRPQRDIHLAPTEAGNSFAESLPKPVLSDGLNGILRAAWAIATPNKRADARPNCDLVAANGDYVDTYSDLVGRWPAQIDDHSNGQQPDNDP